MKGRRTAYIFCLLFVAGISLLQLLPPLLVGGLVDNVLMNESSRTWIETILRIHPDTPQLTMLLRYVIAIVCVALASAIIRYIMHISERILNAPFPCRAAR